MSFRSYSQPLRARVRGFSRDCKAHVFQRYSRYARLSTEEPIVNADGLAGLCLVASYTAKDAGYIPGLIESCAAFEMVILFYDHREGHDFSYNESLRFQLLTEAARRQGASWVLIGSPKTRFSLEFRSQIEHPIHRYGGTPTVLGLRERYLWEDFDHYVVPKAAARPFIVEKLFAVTPNMRFDGRTIHAKQRPKNYQRVIPTKASRYYLGRFSLGQMRSKADFYRSRDGRDYSYLTDVSPPEAHREHLLGIGNFERSQLLGG